MRVREGHDAAFDAVLLAVGLSGADRSPVAGVWRGQLDGRPAVVMTVTEEGEGLAGAALFYLVRREGSQVRSEAGIPEPLLRLRWDGRVLRFAVKPGRGGDEVIRFELNPSGPGQAMLWREGEPVLELVREP